MVAIKIWDATNVFFFFFFKGEMDRRGGQLGGEGTAKGQRRRKEQWRQDED